MLFRLRRLLKAVGRDGVTLWFASRDTRAPLSVKLMAILLATYIIFPVDIVPDMLPILGWFDDAALLGLGLPVILKLIPNQLLGDARFAADRTLSKWKFWRVRN